MPLTETIKPRRGDERPQHISFCGAALLVDPGGNERGADEDRRAAQGGRPHQVGLTREEERALLQLRSRVDKVVTNIGGFDVAYGVGIQPDGKIVAAGFSDVNGTSDFALTRYFP